MAEHVVPARKQRMAEHGSMPSESYWTESRRPIVILAFLLPLILAYELCLWLLLRSRDGVTISTVEAHKRILQFFAAFDIAPTGGLFLGGLLIIAVLLVWHLLARDSWRFRPWVLGGMAVESLLLALPLLVMSMVIATQIPAAAAAPMTDLMDLGVGSRIAISIGAGLYEELVFRMLLIAVIHTLLVDVAKLSHAAGMTVAIVLSAAAFTFYHDLSGLSGADLAQRMVFYFLAGGYFGILFVARGFGIVVGVHATYDILTVLIPVFMGGE